MDNTEEELGRAVYRSGGRLLFSGSFFKVIVECLSNHCTHTALFSLHLFMKRESL